MARPDKVAAVAELTEHFRSANAVVLTEYRGLTVAEISDLRGRLREHATYAVVKNTLTKRAAEQAGADSMIEGLQGPSAIAFVDGDPVEVAKGLKAFAKDHPALVVKAGILDGRPLSADEVRRLADLESREVLLAKLAGAMSASLQQAVSLFAAPLQQAARLVEARRAQVEEGAGASTESAAAEEPPADEAPTDPESADGGGGE